MSKRRYPLARLKPLLGAAVALGLVTFMPRFPQDVGLVLRLLAAGTAVGYLKIENDRHAVESGQVELDAIDQEWLRLEIAIANFEQQMQQATAQFEQRKAHEIEALLGHFRIKLQELQEERQLLEQEITAARAEVEQREALIRSEFERLEKTAIELNARQVTQDTEMRQQRIDFDLELRQLRVNLADRERVVQLAELKLQERRDDLELEFSRQLAVKQQEITRQHQVRIEEVLHEQEKVLVSQQLLEKEYTRKGFELQAALNEASNELRATQMQLEQFKSQKEAEIQALHEQNRLALLQAAQEDALRIQQEYEQQQQQLQEILNRERQQAQTLIDQMIQRVHLLEAQLSEYSKATKFEPAVHGYAGFVGNEILEEIRAFDIGVEPHNAYELPHHNEKNPAVVVLLKKLPGVRHQVLFGTLVSIQQRLKRLSDKIEMGFDPNGFVCLTVGDCKGAISLSENPITTDKDGTKYAENEPVEIVEPTEQQRDDALGNSTMMGIFGPTGMGKSAFTCNVLSYNAAKFGSNAEFYINDLKWPDPDTLWEILGKEVEPDYTDLEGGECLEGVQEMYRTYLSRKAKRRQEKKAHRPIPRFVKRFDVIDEVPALYDTYKAAVSVCIKNTIRIARGLDGRVLIIGQTPRCSDYGMKIPDMSNLTRFYLGAAFATEALKKEIPFISQSQRHRLLMEIRERQKLAAKQLAEGNVNSIGKPWAQYFALVVTQSSEVFLMTLPPPGAYATMERVEESADELKHPLVEDKDLTPVSKQTIDEMVRQAKDDIDGDGTQPPETPAQLVAPTIDTRLMPPLLRAIVDVSLRFNQPLRYSDFVAKSREVRNCAKILGVEKISSLDIKAACFKLVRDWNVGEIVKMNGSDRFHIPPVATPQLATVGAPEADEDED